MTILRRLLTPLTFSFLQALLCLVKQTRQVNHHTITCVTTRTSRISHVNKEGGHFGSGPCLYVIAVGVLGGGQHTDEGDRLLVEDPTGKQVEVILHRVHHHCVARVVPALQ